MSTNPLSTAPLEISSTMPRFHSTTRRSLLTPLTIKPGSGDFFLAQQRKNDVLVAIQLRNPTMTEKVIDAAKRGESPAPYHQPLTYLRKRDPLLILPLSRQRR